MTCIEACVSSISRNHLLHSQFSSRPSLQHLKFFISKVGNATCIFEFKSEITRRKITIRLILNLWIYSKIVKPISANTLKASEVLIKQYVCYTCNSVFVFLSLIQYDVHLSDLSGIHAGPFQLQSAGGSSHSMQRCWTPIHTRRYPGNYRCQ